ncbi:SusE domain-containing protein [Corallibacter sp.]|uniref:SusE domain-containing protein n=1 Tax=Corallibacter sp. TaxID=2038084 RepID=UPI003A94B225
MIKTTKILGFLIFSIICLYSCENDDQDFTASNVSSSILLDADISTIELDDTNPDNPAITITWSDANYGVPTAVRYTVEASADEAFTNPYNAGSSTENSISWNVRELNSIAAGSGVAPFEFYPLYVRVKSALGSQNTLEDFSNTITLSVKSYYNYPFKDVYLVGPACAAGWNNDNSNAAMFRDESNENKYTYTGYFNADQLKIIENKGSWAPQYGGDTSNNLIARPTEDDADPSPIEIATAGYYRFSADLSELSYTLEPYDESTSPILSSVGITGSATPNGSTETSLQQYGIGGTTFDNHIWFLGSVILVPGELQFVINGSDTWGSDTEFSGQTTLGGGSITVIVEDDYEVWFNDLTGEYILIPKTL